MGVYSEIEVADVGDTGTRVSYKVDGSPVTRADLLADEVIARGLAVLTPEVPVVSEEDTQSMKFRLPRGQFWLIDPLDGTKDFLARNGEFTVNIALIQNGVAIFGVVLAPALGQVYWGSMNAGAFRTEYQRVEPIKVALTDTRPHQPLRVVASKSRMNAETIEFMSRLTAYELTQTGSSLKFCRVAEGSADIYPCMVPTCEWDTAAAQAIVEAAGGYVCGIDGAPLRYGKPNVLNPYFVASSLPLSAWLRSA